MLGVLLRVGVSLGILIWLFYWSPRDEVLHVLRRGMNHWPWAVTGLLATFLGLNAGSLRWHRILRAQGIPVRFTRTFRIFFIGQFFNAFLLGACGGDVMRAFLITRETQADKASAALTVLVDRAIGLLVFMAFGSLMILTRMHLMWTRRATRLPALLMGIFLLAAFAALLVLFHRNRFESWPLMQRVERWKRIGPLIRKAYEAFYFFRTRPRIAAISIGFSLLNVWFLTLACYGFGRCLMIDANIWDYFIFFPIITVFTAVPISIGGLGVREWLFGKMFSTVGVPMYEGILLSLFVYLGGVFWSLFGGLLFIMDKEAHSSGHPTI